MAVDLSGLRDIHLPIEPPWWPPAIGWWLLLLGFCVATLVVYGVFLYWWSRPKQYALRELKQIWREQTDTIARARQTSALLKRVALLNFSRRKVAALTGDAWIDFLLSKTGSVFSESQLQLLAFASYMPSNYQDTGRADDLYPAAVQAIKHLFKEGQNEHRRKKSQ